MFLTLRKQNENRAELDGFSLASACSVIILNMYHTTATTQLIHVRELYAMPITMYVTFTVISYNGRGVNNYVNFILTATVCVTQLEMKAK